jgi:hypothetical protein
LRSRTLRSGEIDTTVGARWDEFEAKPKRGEAAGGSEGAKWAMKVRGRESGVSFG